MKKAKKVLALLLALTLICALLAACSGNSGSTADQGGNESDTPAPVEGDTEVIIGYNAYGDVSDFSKKVTEGIMAEAEKMGATVLRADTEGDPATAIQNVDTFLMQGANVIVDCSWVVAACEAVAKKCDDNGVPVVFIDIPVEGYHYMGVDNVQVGQVTGMAAAAYAAKNWDNQVDEVVLVYPEAFGEGVRPRVGGVPEALREAGIDITDSNVTWEDPDGTDNTVASKQIATDFLTAHPDAKHIIFVAGNEPSAQGLLAGIETSNRTENAIVVGVDMGNIGIANMYADEPSVWIGSTGFTPENYGSVVVPMCVDLVNGKTIEMNQYVTTVFIDRENIEKYYENQKG